MRAVRWAPEALTDLKSAFAYVAPHNEVAALALIDRIEVAGNRLGERAIGRSGRVPGTYELSVAKTAYVIAYEILQDPVDDRETIYLLRIIHTSRLWDAGSWPSDEAQ